MALPPYQNHEDIPRGSKVISGGHTDRLVIWWAYFHFCKVS